MCGISGIINLNGKPVGENDIRLMMEKMKHRGPDDEGVFIDGNVGLGFVRLSILDLSIAGHQPMHSHNNRYVIIFNGEVYNYIEIREELKNDFHFKTGTDTEVVLAAYQKWGKSCLDKFNGMFAFVIFDKDTKQIFAARDRFGIKPFYYYQDEEKFIFASEIKSILPLLKSRSINNSIVLDYVAYNRTDHTNKTFFNGIKKLRHGYTLLINKTKIDFVQWYSLRDKIKDKKTILSRDEYQEILTDSVKLRLRSDVRVGVSLSGGLDSSSITSLVLNKLNLPNISSFSAVYNTNESYDEYEFIKLYSSQMDNMFYTYPSKETFLNDYKEFIGSHSEPVNDVGSYIQYKVMELVSKHVKVVLDGQGADEQLGGYHNFFGSYYKELLNSGKLLKFIKENFHYLSQHKSPEALKYFIYYILPIKLKKSTNKLAKGSINKEFFNSYSKDSSIISDIYHPLSLHDSLIQHFEYKLEHLLKWDDINSMKFSIESRVPFLDYRLVEASLNLPSDLILKNGTTKYLLRESMKDILPKKIVERKDKKGFSNPRREWFKTPEFQELIFDTLNSNDFQNLNIFDVKDATQKYKNHLADKSDYSIDIWKWININEWKKQIVDK